MLFDAEIKAVLDGLADGDVIAVCDVEINDGVFASREVEAISTITTDEGVVS